MLPPNTELDSNINIEPNNQIPGLTYIPEYISLDEQNLLVSIIDQKEWSTKTQRRVQHYGYQYDYKSGLLASSSYLGALPNWLQNIAKRLESDRLTAQLPDQVIINEYQPGQGINNHIDCIPCFGKIIISLSLASPCLMDFTQADTSEQIPILLLPGSLIVMQEAARYKWQHGIAARKKDHYQDKETTRKRRVSITFREVLFPYK
ncbi:MAG: alpha-ketoglutarate-dependent dioxygenase AlkB [Coleofasciculaceae cyanobacterium]